MNENGTYHAGVVGTVTISQIENAMGVKYMGWSNTISGQLIPLPPPPPAPKPKPKTSRGELVDQALEILLRAEKRNAKSRLRKARIHAARLLLLSLPKIK